MESGFPNKTKPIHKGFIFGFNDFLEMKYFWIFLLLPFFASSQTHRFVYEYQFKRDSTEADLEKMNMVLDINPDEAKFYSYDYVETDSLNKIRGIRRMLWDDSPAIIRKLGSYKNQSYILIDNLFYFETEDKMNWKLSEETKNSAGYHLQKATTQFGGRIWNAWFAKDLNINEGPYKFRGLPGLIFEISDSQENFIFKLVKSYQLNQTFNTRELVENFAGMQPVKISDKTYQKLILDSYGNPIKEIMESFKENKNPDNTFYVNGIQIKSADQFKELKEMRQLQMRKYNNPIERNKIIHYPSK